MAWVSNIGWEDRGYIESGLDKLDVLICWDVVRFRSI